jgi:hypothetical protein
MKVYLDISKFKRVAQSTSIWNLQRAIEFQLFAGKYKEAILLCKKYNYLKNVRI